MAAKYLKRGMHPQTRAALDNVMSDTVFMAVKDIAAGMKRSVRGTEQKLMRLYDKGFVERTVENVVGGGTRFLWRRLPEGYVAPLYDVQPGVDARALDECLGGYTFLKKDNRRITT